MNQYLRPIECIGHQLYWKGVFHGWHKTAEGKMIAVCEVDGSIVWVEEHYTIKFLDDNDKNTPQSVNILAKEVAEHRTIDKSQGLNCYTSEFEKIMNDVDNDPIAGPAVKNFLYPDKENISDNEKFKQYIDFVKLLERELILRRGKDCTIKELRDAVKSVNDHPLASEQIKYVVDTQE